MAELSAPEPRMRVSRACTFVKKPEHAVIGGWVLGSKATVAHGADVLPGRAPAEAHPKPRTVTSVSSSKLTGKCTLMWSQIGYNIMVCHQSSVLLRAIP